MRLEQVDVLQMPHRWRQNDGPRAIARKQFVRIDNADPMRNPKLMRFIIASNESSIRGPDRVG
jgi:hypothetical protein